jgi:hypothetical protein
MTLATDDTRLPPLFAHSTRKDWGVGVLAWEAGGKRGYLFEDGEERTMASGFHELMRRVEQPNPDQKAASLKLQRVLAARASAHASVGGLGGPTFPDQLARFHEVYPEGLQDPKWVQDVRGEGVEQRAPRHRTALAQQAQTQLSAAALDALIGAQKYEQVWELVVSVLSHTDLVPSAQLKKPKSSTIEQQKDLAVATRELLYGKFPFEQRFDRFVTAVSAYTSEPARWEIATALSAVAYPNEHVCVHPTVFRLQLKATGSRGTAAARPTSAGYTRLLNVARIVAKKLNENGEAPRDLLDVHDFIRITMKPPTKVRMSSVRASARSVAPAAAADEEDEQQDDESEAAENAD